MFDNVQSKAQVKDLLNTGSPSDKAQAKAPSFRGSPNQLEKNRRDLEATLDEDRLTGGQAIPEPVRSLRVSGFTDPAIPQRIISSTPATPYTTPQLDISWQLQSIQRESTEIQRQQVHLLKRLMLPAPKPPIFEGDILEFPKWESAFDALIEEDGDSSRKLYYLGQYTGGAAQRTINGLLGLRTEDAYTRARKMLKERFGNPYRIYEEYRKKLFSWPTCKLGKDLQELSDFLAMTQETMKTVGYLRELNSLTFIRQLATRLPAYYCNKWRVSAKRIEDEMGEYTFNDLVEFVQNAASDATHPVFSLESLSATRRELETGKERSGYFAMRNTQRNEAKRSQGSTFATSVSSQDTTREKLDNSYVRKCPLCDKPHELEQCKTFLGKTPHERVEVCKSKGVCFSCLTKGHMARRCRKRTECEVCKKSHATLLHFDTQADVNQPSQETAKANSNCVSTCHLNDCNHTRTSMIVPVWIQHEDNPSLKVETYAVLDDQSDTCFVTNEICSQLSLSGPEIILKLGTMHSVENVLTRKIEGLVISRCDGELNIPLPRAYSREQIPVRREQIPTPETASSWKHLHRISDKIQPYRKDLAVGILIGNNCPQAIKPRDVIPGKSKDPYAIRTTLGWGIIGAAPPQGTLADENMKCCHRTTTTKASSHQASTDKFIAVRQCKEVLTPDTIRTLLERDFSDGQANGKPLSQEDQRFLKTMKEGIHLTDDQHYEMPLPLRDENIVLPCNRKQAEIRLEQLKRRFQRDPQYQQDYTAFVEDMLTKGYAEKAPPDARHTWYIPHHGVYHAKKPGKIRVVFDCSAESNGQSLNSNLLQGPDLSNSLLGVLCRFRQEPIAVACDIEGMFHQVRVNTEHRDLLRFLWWEGGKVNKDPQEYRMTVHLFGATSSPGCANLALKMTADDNETDLGADSANFLRRNFYVDDGLKSVRRPEEAIELVKKSREMCRRGGFRLHKFMSNSKTVIESIPEEDRASGIKNIDLDKQPLPLERVLGVEWCIENDSLQFRITLKDKPLTRRGILATVSSIYDPLGLAAPLLLHGKRILQLLCKENAGWDDPIPPELRSRWEKWRAEIPLLEELNVPRCFRPTDFGELKTAELHHFSDACNEGYGQCSYLRIVDEKDRIHCSLVMGKARVTPLKPTTIPRLELAAAVVSVKASEALSQDLEYEPMDETFWTDSMVVKAYIQNEARRFHTFVANRVQQIREHTSPDQWVYVASEDNPADDASRGLSVKQLTQNSRWIHGPRFLWEPRETWSMPEKGEVTPLSPDDKEVKRVCALSSTSTPAIIQATLLERLSYFSEWFRAIRAVANCLRYLRILRSRVSTKKAGAQLQSSNVKRQRISVEELKNAEATIIMELQREVFAEEIKVLRSSSPGEFKRGEVKDRNREIKKVSQLYRLDPFLDQRGVLRVGGRLRHSSMPDDLKHPIILPRKSNITELVIKYYHNKCNHQGRGMTINELRSSGFWIIGCTSAVSEMIHNCCLCRKTRSDVQNQKMADLPPDRLQDSPPFTYCGVDCFGPWHVKVGRKDIKRYGVLFTCMTSRAIHLEVAHSLEADSFINALRRFICRRGPVRQIRSDQGTNFIGASNELKKALSEMNQQQVATELLKLNCDWVETKFNVPSASHMGGVWERQIKTVRSVLTVLLHKNGGQLNDEGLATFMCEAEAIVNSRPLTTDNLTSADSLEPLTPNHLVTMKTKIVLPPPGVFESADGYSRKMWRRVQHLSNEFWTRWKKEFLQSLQQRSKWSRTRRNIQSGDIVIVKEEDIPRNVWKLGRVTDAYKDDDGLVRKVKLLVGDRNLAKDGRRTRNLTTLERPIHKLVLLQRGDSSDERPGIPVEEP